MYKPPFWINLPSEITINIMLRLPIKTILSCKCVCKQWLELLSTPEFARSHLSISTPGLAVQQGDGIYKIFEFEDVLDLQHHDLHYNPVIQFGVREAFSSINANILILGSVNGLLLFSGIHDRLLYSLYVCNPITREYIPLPEPQGIIKSPDRSEYGFGVSATTGQYKVVRKLHKCSNYPGEARCSRIQDYECMVYTIGTGSWRIVPSGAPFGDYHLSLSVFLNGNLHGLSQDCSGSGNMLISCFDLEIERFKPFPPPPPSMNLYAYGSLGVLDDCLCYCDNNSEEEDTVVIWVMKEYGVEKSWTKLFVVVDAQDYIGQAFEIVYAIKAFKDGDVLLYWDRVNLFYYSSKNKTCQEVDLFPGKPKSGLDVIPFKPSFISLKSFHGEIVKLFS